MSLRPYGPERNRDVDGDGGGGGGALGRDDMMVLANEPKLVFMALITGRAPFSRPHRWRLGTYSTTMWRAVLANRSYLILILTPLACLPLPLLLPGKESLCGYTILLMAIFWCTEALPLAITSLFPVIFFPLMGIMDSTEVCQEYLKDTNMLFVGGLVVAIAVEHWNLHKRIALSVLLLIGVRPAALLVGFMGITAFLSMWVSNTATTAMMVPIAQAVLDELHRSEVERLRAAAVAVANGNLNPGFELQENGGTQEAPAPGNGHMVTLEKVAQTEEEQRLEEKHLSFSKGMSLAICYSASIGGIATITGTSTNLVLKGQMEELFPNNTNVINFASWFGFAFPTMTVLLVLSWLWLQVLFFGFKGQQGDSHHPGPPGLVNGQPETVMEHRPSPGIGVCLGQRKPGFGSVRMDGEQTHPLQNIPAPAIAFIVCLMVAAITECASNVATTTLFLPILASMAQAICLNPLYVMLPCTLAASLAFMLPVATPPNSIVFSYGHLRVIDMVKAGCVLNVVGVLTVTLAMNTWAFPMFDLYHFPAWANSTSGQC
ncbi:hypothetical protein JRQ81_008349 [Phrynocephalus forsythii]|uniref:Solute carrier family 13 member 2 n=1 Tax=Phrynocephalus forsythii TaxID=171643 RepID=A0A9Q0XBV5_9SAUR|nr:hypothetical protein JRQ81_008349 [Phrynocephalus forsythii]